MEKINLECLQYLEENRITKDKLPKPIVKKMNSLAGLTKRYENKPTNNTKIAITKIDIDVCDLIADWVEQDFPADYVDENPNSIDAYLELANEDVEPTPTPKPTAEPTATTTTPPQPKPTPTPSPEPKAPEPKPASDTEKKVEEMVAEIKKNLNSDNRIKVSVLASIIGASPSYPTQVVGELKLVKVFLNDYYKLT